LLTNLRNGLAATVAVNPDNVTTIANGPVGASVSTVQVAVEGKSRARAVACAERKLQYATINVNGVPLGCVRAKVAALPVQ